MTKNTRNIILYGTITGLLCIFMLIIYSRPWIFNELDFNFHLQLIIELKEYGLKRLSAAYAYPGYHVSVLFFLLIGIPLNWSNGIVMSLCFLAAVLVTYNFFIRRTDNFWGSAFSSIAVNFISALPSIFTESISVGQGSPNVWHSPTYTFMKPFFILIIDYVDRWLNSIQKSEDEDKQGLSNHFVWISLFLFLSTIAKPSFTLIFLTTAGVYGVFLIITKKVSSRELIRIVLAFIPTIGLMIVQYLWVYYMPDLNSEPTSFKLDMFKLWMNKTNGLLLYAVLLEIAFPLVLMLFGFGKGIGKGYVFAWLLYVISFLQYGLLAEGGKRYTDGNFVWGYKSAQYILFMYSILILLHNYKNIFKQKKSLTKLKFIGCSMILILYILSGAVNFLQKAIHYLSS